MQIFSRARIHKSNEKQADAAARRISISRDRCEPHAHDRIEQALKAEVEDALITIHVEPDGKAKHCGIVVL